MRRNKIQRKIVLKSKKKTVKQNIGEKPSEHRKKALGKQMNFKENS